MTAPNSKEAGSRYAGIQDEVDCKDRTDYRLLLWVVKEQSHRKGNRYTPN